MRLILCAFFSFLCMVGVAQGRKVPLDKGFVDKTIEYYYTTVVKQHPGNAIFFIEKDSITMSAKTEYTTFKIQFLSAAEAAKKTADKGVGKLDKLMVKWVSLDTIDVVITGCTIGVRNVNKIVNNKRVTSSESFLTNCTEEWVDIPTCRFVYNPMTTAWTQVNHGKLVK